MRRAYATAVTPAGVGTAPLRPRSKSTAPILLSPVRTAWETADCVIPSLAAAPEKLPVLSTAAMIRSSCGVRSIIARGPLLV